jgi:hypothetical protein
VGTFHGGYFGDAFVAKVSTDSGGVPAGRFLVYAGYIGGSESDFGGGIALDGEGDVYVVGSTASDERTFPDGDGFGPIHGPDRTYNGESDAFVVKLSELLDAVPPAVMVGTLALNPPKGLQIPLLIHDLASGLAGIQVDFANSQNISQVIADPFQPGTQQPVPARVFLVNPDLPARLRLRVTDRAANLYAWNLFAMPLLGGGANPASTAVPWALPAEQHWVTLFNGTPGLTSLRITVNGKPLDVTGLKAGEVRKLSLAPLTQDGGNQVALTPLGPSGSRAHVMFYE